MVCVTVERLLALLATYTGQQAIPLRSKDFEGLNSPLAVNFSLGNVRVSPSSPLSRTLFSASLKIL